MRLHVVAEGVFSCLMPHHRKHCHSYIWHSDQIRWSAFQKSSKKEGNYQGKNLQDKEKYKGKLTRINRLYCIFTYTFIGHFMCPLVFASANENVRLCIYSGL